MEEANQLLRDAALTSKVMLEIEFDVAGKRALGRGGIVMIILCWVQSASLIKTTTTDVVVCNEIRNVHPAFSMPLLKVIDKFK